jgi:hypothetical protein
MPDFTHCKVLGECIPNEMSFDRLERLNKDIKEAHPVEYMQVKAEIKAADKKETWKTVKKMGICQKSCGVLCIATLLAPGILYQSWRAVTRQPQELESQRAKRYALQLVYMCENTNLSEDLRNKIPKKELTSAAEAHISREERKRQVQAAFRNGPVGVGQLGDRLEAARS